MTARASRIRSASLPLFCVAVAAIGLATLGAPHVARAATIWTDSDGDGLPDTSKPFVIPPSTNFTVGVWIDSEGFAWTGFAAYVEWPPGIFSYVSAQYVVTGGSNFPIDNFSHPSGMGFSGSGFSRNGVTHIGNVFLHVDLPFATCVTPITDEQNPYRVVSILTDVPAYTLFPSANGSCYGVPPELQACCFPDGSCADILEDECPSAGGDPAGSGTSCATFVCPRPPGACCLPNGGCAIVREVDCENAGGVFQGEGTDCGSVDCPEPPPPTGPCCFFDGEHGTCVVMTFVDCVLEGGSWLSRPGDDCEGVDCDPNGACCFPSGLCTLNGGRTRCENRGGVWIPDGTCPQSCDATTIEPRSWGSIKALYR
jgi:hypothetical protein